MISGTPWKHDEKIMIMEWSISASSSHESEIDKEQIFLSANRVLNLVWLIKTKSALWFWIRNFIIFHFWLSQLGLPIILGPTCMLLSTTTHICSTFLPLASHPPCSCINTHPCPVDYHDLLIIIPYWRTMHHHVKYSSFLLSGVVGCRK